MNYGDIWELIYTVLIWWAVIGLVVWFLLGAAVHWLDAFIPDPDGESPGLEIFSPKMNWPAIFFLGPVFWIIALGIFLKNLWLAVAFVWEMVNFPFTK